MLVGDSFSTVFIVKHYTLKWRIKTGAEKHVGICGTNFSLWFDVLSDCSNRKAVMHQPGGIVGATVSTVKRAGTLFSEPAHA